jgi:hypothetical protein
MTDDIAFRIIIDHLLFQYNVVKNTARLHAGLIAFGFRYLNPPPIEIRLPADRAAPPGRGCKTLIFDPDSYRKSIENFFNTAKHSRLNI